MDINIRGDKIKITESIKEYIEEKIKKIEKYFEEPEEIKSKVLIRLSGKDQIIEVTVRTKQYTLRAEEREEDLYAAIDEVIDKIERQIRKNKTKLKRRYKNVEMTEFVEEEKEEEKKIERRKIVETKPMDEEEAILQMELIGHDFFVFKNIEEECVSVIYKRKNQTYGILNVK